MCFHGYFSARGEGDAALLRERIMTTGPASVCSFNEYTMNYILQCGEIHFAELRNPFYSVDKYTCVSMGISLQGERGMQPS